MRNVPAANATPTSVVDLTTVRGQFESLFRPHKLRHKSAKTVYKYRLELNRFDHFLGRPAMLPDLNDVAVGDAAEWVLSKEGLDLSVESTRGFQGRICRVWDFLARKHIVADFPTIENLRRTQRVPKAWRREELRVLWQALKRQPGEIGGLAVSDFFCSFLTVMWRTSERPGALLQVEWPDVDLRDGWLRIAPEKRKGGRQGRVYRLTGDCVEWLDRIREPARKIVWPWPHTYSYIFPRWKEILRCAGLPHDRDRMFSCVRASHASHLEAAGGDATLSLGHASRETTVRSYLDPTIAHAGQEWPGDRLFPLE